MDEQARIIQALSFLERWYNCYDELVNSAPPESLGGATGHNIASRDEYANAIAVIKRLQGQPLNKMPVEIAARADSA
ncbi:MULTISPECIES: hypothetical protein [unclassified Bradyrhizobium]|uniref:hypothetical protein n=1 Tax=unclassified Bradyrhizobium TaxID=2631580 RepID=UPI0023AF5CD1|nr:hypothetical protein [Bradyrhizobium sp. CSS354]MDE5464917.1 hypothetical protein [Bradyrhizobium sp. CSS354]